MPVFEFYFFFLAGFFVNMTVARVNVMSVIDEKIIMISELVRMWTAVVVIPILREQPNM
jgi:hypothetical protein